MAWSLQQRPIVVIVNKSHNITLNGDVRGTGRPKLIWDAVVKEDMYLLKLTKHIILDKVAWQKGIHVAE